MAFFATSESKNAFDGIVGTIKCLTAHASLQRGTKGQILKCPETYISLQQSNFLILSAFMCDLGIYIFREFIEHSFIAHLHQKLIVIFLLVNMLHVYIKILGLLVLSLIYLYQMEMLKYTSCTVKTHHIFLNGLKDRIFVGYHLNTFLAS